MNQNSACPRCGAKMNFNEDKYILTCPYCDEEVRLERPIPTPPAPTSAPQPVQDTMSEEQIRRLSAELRQSQASQKPRKSKSTTLLLCFFLGGLGIHQFYLGNTWRGIGYLVLTCSVVGFWVACVISLIDFIILCCTSEDALQK